MSARKMSTPKAPPHRPYDATKAAPSVLTIATGKARAKRGAASNARLGKAFEDVVGAALAQVGHVAHCQPATKVVRGPNGPCVIYTAKEGVDFVGVAHGVAIAIECKRLPGAASLSGAKDDSTRWEAVWLARFIAQRGQGAFFVYDPDAASGVGAVYVVRDCAPIALGGAIKLRTPDGAALVVAFNARDLAAAVTRAVAWVAAGALP